MRGIQAGAPPAAFVRERASGVTYANLHSTAEVRAALWGEQRGLCAYCERSLGKQDPARHRTKIEHFHPQNNTTGGPECTRNSGDSNLDTSPTSWTNMLLCCDGASGAAGVSTCDTSKHGTDICAEFRNPKDWPGDQAMLIVSRDGTVSAGPGLPEGADEVINKVLNLNANHLLKLRHERRSSWMRKYNKQKERSHGLTAKQKQEFAQKIRDAAATSDVPTALLSLADTISPS